MNNHQQHIEHAAAPSSLQISLLVKQKKLHVCRIEWHLIFRRHNRRQNYIQKATLMLILVFWWPPCSHFFPGWVLGKIIHIPYPWSTPITALYVNRNFIVSENRAIICFCWLYWYMFQNKTTLCVFYSIPCPGISFAYCALCLESWTMTPA